MEKNKIFQSKNKSSKNQNSKVKGAICGAGKSLGSAFTFIWKGE